MSDEKKPFMVCIEDERGVFRPELDGRPSLAILLSWSQAQAVTTEVNRAVEAREARLRGALQSVIAELVGIDTTGMQHPVDSNAPWARAERAHRVALAALGPNPPDYVPRAALVEAEAKVKALQAVNDTLDGLMSDKFVSPEVMSETARVVAAHLEAAGLRKPEPKPPGDPKRGRVLADLVELVGEIARTR
jgi:hypothetical protein